MTKMILQNPTTLEYYSLDNGILIHLPDTNPSTIDTYGIASGVEISLDVFFTTHRYVTFDSSTNTYNHTDDTTSTFSVYGYISDTPKALIKPATTNDVTVSTKTKPYTIYDELGDDVELLYYTDDTAVTKADMNITANWSPIDELDGDFEVVTWTDETDPATKRTLEVQGTPSPKFTYSLTVTDIEKLKDVIVTDLSTTYNKSNVRFLLSPDNVDWYRFNGTVFEKMTSMTNQAIKEKGMTYDELQSITDIQFESWNFKKVNVGVYLEDDARGTIVSNVNPLQIEHLSPSNTTQLSGTSLYVLNTTARIDVDLKGLTLLGSLSDDDMSRVQYRIRLNGNPYFPADGQYTALSPAPQPVSITMQSDEIKIDDWNTLEVDFQDFFGTTDTWSATFMGKYAGVVFMDTNGDYYSTDMGQVLKYLDFGTVLTGQVTPSYEVKLKNQFGYKVKDVELSADTSEFSKGLLFEFSQQADFSTFSKRLNIPSLEDEEEFTFYVRMQSSITTEPNGNNTFNIYVTATKDV